MTEDTSTPDVKPVLCDACGESMLDGENGVNTIGISLSYNGDSPGAKRFMDTFGKSTMNICIVCCALSLGCKKK